ncbi:NAD(P)(+) transhydrogenase (Re/Si-specific) subunit beta [Dactylosporangium sp. NPDC050688]|uniref:NAD(P)(+) transhydrogenase (Re/Si-specific) subunit beta n=1 Tax=Dactylosporangium sp. NPDC050688 TaxID=3157217 RepID=UPI0033D3DE85
MSTPTASCRSFPSRRRTGPAADAGPVRRRAGSARVLVIKRSMGHGYAGIDNPLYIDPRTGMLFADAKQGLTDIIAAVRTLVA